MKANELRIGNYVNVEFCRLCNNDFYWQQHQINPLDFENILMYPDKYKPITLTKKWLVRLGFFRVKGDLALIGEFAIHERLDGFYFIPTTNRKVLIKYVHQLQNLFFALTGEELTIKE